MSHPLFSKTIFPSIYARNSFKTYLLLLLLFEGIKCGNYEESAEKRRNDTRGPHITLSSPFVDLAHNLLSTAAHNHKFHFTRRVKSLVIDFLASLLDYLH